MSGTNGKIALVDSFDCAARRLSASNPHFMDLVGYGAANCGEGGDQGAGAVSIDRGLPS